MGLGIGTLLTAVGAILVWAVNVEASGLNLTAIGWILMIVGLLSIVLSLVFWSTWAGPGYATRRRTGYVEERPVAPARRTVVEEDVI